MKIFPLPSQQETYNAKLNRSIKSLLAASILIFLGALGLVAAVWWVGPHKVVNLPSLIGPDNSFLGSAVVVSPEYALCAIDTVPQGSSIEFPDKSRVPVDTVRKETITPETRVTLLRIKGSLPGSAAPITLSEAVNGIQAEAASTDTMWKGSLSETQDGIFMTQPALTVGPGAPVQDAVNHAMLGLTGRMDANGIVVSTQRLMKVFPELRGAR